MKRLSLLLAALLVTSAAAQDRPSDSSGSKVGDRRQKQEAPAAALTQPTTASAVHSSPFPTPTPTDTRFVVDDGYPGLDTDCTFRSEGSLKFKVSVKRYVGELNGDGTLADPQELITNGVVSEFATLRMPAFDVDFDGVPDVLPERDRILFNGEPVGNLEGDAYLRGLNANWIMNEYKIPIRLVRFGEKGTNGNEPTPGENEIEILIDQANVETGEEPWCTSIDWASLEFKAMAPVVMIPGNGVCKEFFNGDYRCNGQPEGAGFVQPFQSQSIPYDNSIDLSTPKRIQENAAILLEQVPRVAREFGAKWVHLVGHSKGGLDARDFLTKIPKDPATGESVLGVLSLTTLSAPHHGSVGADIIYKSREANIIGLPFSNQLRDVLIARFLQTTNRGREHLTTWHLEEKFNPENLPKLPRSFTVGGETHPINYFSFSADANIDNSYDDNDLRKPTIQQSEVTGTGRGPRIMTEVYRFLWKTKTVEVKKSAKIVKRVVTTQAEGVDFDENDFLVTTKSATLTERFAAQPRQDANHATIASDAVGALVIPLIKASEPR